MYIIYKEKYKGYTMARNTKSGKFIARSKVVSFEAETLKQLMDAIDGYELI